jgi:hypothetical protein
MPRQWAGGGDHKLRFGHRGLLLVMVAAVAAAHSGMELGVGGGGVRVRGSSFQHCVERFEEKNQAG